MGVKSCPARPLQKQQAHCKQQAQYDKATDKKVHKLGACFYAVAACRGGHKLLVDPPDEPLQLASNPSGELHDSSAARHTAHVRCCITSFVEGLQH